ncbi:hypothetical protein ASPWEDRAFT_176021 [Aspergillus wentii DTO 134E9]|uniref:Uncharacterized protein n=1 Tax=Aspergillus wentii DTO 134E9 TaxID=1073089 RepID=A0A1L9R7L9_ASPWE|nr:uncharacterized protein ASPWEDRAFT_176021 [Aspergillus wentii DTO 134E9]KAI9927540.1 hypothetical protein MW887_003158 [Aspergillus wentii]OJJ30916.1 hypothetical protein ASPWEDRAFT_176021 [Aspergillus wentii DTO 134E9]
MSSVFLLGFIGGEIIDLLLQEKQYRLRGGWMIHRPDPISPGNYNDCFSEYSGTIIGANSRNRATRLRKLGWKAREKKTLASLAEDEIPLILPENGDFAGYTVIRK